MLMDVFERARRRTAGATWIRAAGRHQPARFPRSSERNGELRCGRPLYSKYVMLQPRARELNAEPCSEEKKETNPAHQHRRRLTDSDRFSPTKSKKDASL